MQSVQSIKELHAVPEVRVLSNRHGLILKLSERGWVLFQRMFCFILNVDFDVVEMAAAALLGSWRVPICDDHLSGRV